MARVTTLDGLPAHVLLLHAVIVLVPLAAILLVLVVLWPRAHRRLAPLTAVLSVAALIAVPLTTDAGEWLERRVPRTALVHDHTELGDTMLPWAVALAVVAIVIAGWDLVVVRVTRDRPGGGRIVRAARAGTGYRATSSMTTALVALVAVVIAVGSVVTVYRIGESGARAVWTDRFSSHELPRPLPGVAPTLG